MGSGDQAPNNKVARKLSPEAAAESFKHMLKEFATLFPML
jgi:hypothetical protein